MVELQKYNPESQDSSVEVPFPTVGCLGSRSDPVTISRLTRCAVHPPSHLFPLTTTLFIFGAFSFVPSPGGAIPFFFASFSFSRSRLMAETATPAG